MLPLLVVRVRVWPASIPRRSSSSGCILAIGAGSIASRTSERRVIAPVCQCSSILPVRRTYGYSSSGASAVGVSSTGTSFPRPDRESVVEGKSAVRHGRRRPATKKDGGGGGQ